MSWSLCTYRTGAAHERYVCPHTLQSCPLRPQWYAARAACDTQGTARLTGAHLACSVHMRRAPPHHSLRPCVRVRQPAARSQLPRTPCLMGLGSKVVVLRVRLRPWLGLPAVASCASATPCPQGPRADARSSAGLVHFDVLSVRPVSHPLSLSSVSVRPRLYELPAPALAS